MEYTLKINSTDSDVKKCSSITTLKEMCENFDVYEKVPDDRPVHPYFDIDYYNPNPELKPSTEQDVHQLCDVLIELAKK